MVKLTAARPALPGMSVHPSATYTVSGRRFTAVRPSASVSVWRVQRTLPSVSASKSNCMLSTRAQSQPSAVNSSAAATAFARSAP